MVSSEPRGDFTLSRDVTGNTDSVETERAPAYALAHACSTACLRLHNALKNTAKSIPDGVLSLIAVFVGTYFACGQANAPHKYNKIA
jgi:hypothetical protein